MFSDCLTFLGTLFLRIFAFMDSVVLVGDLSLFDFSIGLSFLAIAVAVVRGVFGGSDNR